MLIKRWMSKPVVTVEKDASLMDVSDLFKTKIISMVPVMDDGRIIGIVTDGDIKKASPSKATSLDIYELMTLVRKIKITSLMSSPVITIPGNFTVDEAAAKMLANNISGMPVMGDNGKMEGIITKSDIFRCLVSFTGAGHKGQTFAFKVKDRSGIVQDLMDSVRNHRARIHSVLTSNEEKDDGFRKIIIHTFGIAPDRFDPMVKALGAIAEMTYAADQTTGQRIVF
ncbi:AcuB3 [Desulforapulum autotrophicum HRM2]|uniref:AcuB3 n=1 Tax=Desulforapulum autotrophicum (strain ATCC 43914 / DSM 3382 / VKM B-1955 / HRM2) TaxID=177437 RepID=C0QC64_DESAH|nr:CBS and ACT domain-containing protein [Desulforapulum autotrophicum]ACN17081.1 AcuB3 [Desulforapulum autotrophicum HRM2]